MPPEGFQGQHPALFECREVGGGGRRCGIGEVWYRASGRKRTLGWEEGARGPTCCHLCPVLSGWW